MLSKPSPQPVGSAHSKYRLYRSKQVSTPVALYTIAAKNDCVISTEAQIFWILSQYYSVISTLTLDSLQSTRRKPGETDRMYKLLGVSLLMHV